MPHFDYWVKKISPTEQLFVLLWKDEIITRSINTGTNSITNIRDRDIKPKMCQQTFL